MTGRRLDISDAEPTYALQRVVIADAGGRLHEMAERRLAPPAGAPAIFWAADALLTSTADPAVANVSLEAVVTQLDALPQDYVWIATLLLAGEAAAVLEELDAALVIVDQLAPSDGAHGVSGIGTAFLGPVARVLGRLSAVLGDARSAHRLLSKARKEAGGAGEGAWATRAAQDLARVS